MATTNDKYRSMVEKIYNRTINKKLSWVIDEIDGAVGFRLGDNLIELTKETIDGTPFAFIKIRSKDGALIEKFSDGNLDNGNRPSAGIFDSYYQLMVELRDIALRQARGADDALDAILSELDE